MANRKVVIEFLGKDKTLGSTSDSLGGKLAGFGKKLAAGTALAGAALTTFVAKSGVPYVANLNKIQALTGASDAQMRATAKTLERNALQYARLGMSAGDASAGVVELTKAGMSLSAAMQAVDDTMVLAKAGQLSVADASSLVSNSLNVFKLRAKDAGTVANALANAANISSADVSDLAQSLAMAGNVAAGSGMTVQQTAAALAELANAGMKGSDAGTSLKTMLLSLQAPSSTAAKNLAALGVSAFDAAGKARPIRAVLGDLDEKFRGLTDQERAKRLKGVFGSDAFRAARVIFGNGAKVFDEFTRKVDKAGAAQKAAEAESKGLWGTLKMGFAAVRTAAEGLYRVLSPFADDLLRPLVEQASVLALKVAPAVSKALSGMGSGGGGFMSALRDGFSELAKYGRQFLPILREIGGKVMGVVGPGLASLGEAVRTKLLPAFRDIMPVIAPVAKFLLRMFGDALVGMLKGAFKVLKGLVTVVSGVFKAVAALVRGDWSAAWQGLKDIVSGALEAVVGVIQFAWNFGIVSVFRKGFMFLVRDVWKKGWSLIQGAARGGMNLLGNLVKGGLSAIWRGFSGAVRGYWGLWKRLFGLLRDVTVNGWKVLRSAFGSAVSALRSVVSGLAQGVLGIIRGMWSAHVALWRKGFDAVAMAVFRGWIAVGKFIASIPGRILSAVGNLGRLLWNAGVAVVQGLIDGIKSMIGKVVDTLKGITKLIPNVKGPLDKDKKLLTPAGVAIMGGLIKGVESQRAALRRTLGQVTGDITGQPLARLGVTGDVSWSAGSVASAGVASGARAASAAGGGSVTIIVNGARDPQAVADEVYRKLLAKKRKTGMALGLA